MKVTIGGREQIATASLSVPAKEDAWIEFAADSWNVRLHVVFIDDEANKSQTFAVSGEGDHAVITISNWTNALPAAVEDPIVLGEVNGRRVFFSFAGYAVKQFKKLDFSFFWEARHGS